MFKHLFRGLALGVLGVGLMASSTTAQNGTNFHVLSNGFDVIYLGIGAGGTTTVAGVDGIGAWLYGEDMKGSTLTALGGFGYHQTAFRTSQCILGAPSPTLRIDFAAIIFVEMDGRNANAPDVFLIPGCTTAGVVGLTSAGVIPYGTPPGSSANFILSLLPSGAGLASSIVCLLPNNGLTPSSNGGTATLVAAASASLPIASTGFCWVVEFTWTPSSLVSSDHIDGWWHWLTNSRDGNQYWGMSSDELNAFQSQTVYLDGGATALVAFFSSTDYEWHSMTVNPSTNSALAPVGSNGTGTYYATSTVVGGSSVNGGFDLGRHGGASISGMTGAINPATGLANQDPAGSPTAGLIPTLGFATWNNEVYTGPGGVVGGFRLTWVQYNWDTSFGVNPDLAIPALVFLGTVRVPVCIPSTVPAPWPQPYPTTTLWPFYIHNTSDQTGNALWPDPNGFAGGTFANPPTVGASTHLPLGAVAFTDCIGVPIAWGYGSTGLLGPAGPLTWRPDVNATSTGRVLVLLD